MTDATVRSLVLAGCLALASAASAASAGQGNYTRNMSLEFVYYSGAAYCDKQPLQNWTCGACIGPGNNAPPLVNVTQLYNHTGNGNDSGDVYGYVGAAQGGAIVVAFRGTDPSDLRNWIDDLSVFPTKISPAACPGCEVHSGFFLDSYAPLSGQMWAALDGLRAAELQTPVYVTGHSLGGAMAELAAWELVLAGLNVQAFHTFGTPRVGNDQWAATFQAVVQDGNATARDAARAAAADALLVQGGEHVSPFLAAALARRRDIADAASRAGTAYNQVAVWRVTHASDIVPHLPPQLFGFKHITQEAWWDEPSANVRICSATDGEDRTCADSVALPISVEDHLHYLGVHISGLC